MQCSVAIISSRIITILLFSRCSVPVCTKRTCRPLIWACLKCLTGTAGADASATWPFFGLLTVKVRLLGPVSISTAAVNTRHCRGLTEHREIAVNTEGKHLSSSDQGNSMTLCSKQQWDQHFQNLALQLYKEDVGEEKWTIRRRKGWKYRKKSKNKRNTVRPTRR
jgi:hypothetical protein